MNPALEIAAIRESAREQAVALYGSIEHEADVLAQMVMIARRGMSPGYLRLEPVREVLPAKERAAPIGIEVDVRRE